jgi:pimeloyl-ACP methyl ester carboxylesterase
MTKPSEIAQVENRTTVRNPVASLIGGGIRVLERGAPDLAAAAAATLFRTPPRRRKDPAMEALLATARRGSLEVMGTDVTTWSWGEGPVILLAHGWGSRGGRLGAFVEPLVSRGFSVTTWDAPGHGASGGRLSSLIQFAAAITAAGRAASDSGRVHGVVAHSLGGSATVLAMRHHGLAVDSAVFLAPPSNPTPFTIGMAQMLGFSEKTRLAMQARIERSLSFRWDDLDVPTVAPHMTSRLLVFHDRADKEVPFAHGAAIAAAWPGARLVATEGLGHKRIVSEPSIVRDAVDFVAAGTRSIAAGARQARG